MTKVKQMIWLTLILGVASVMVGCSSPPTEESKPMQAGDGSQKPVASGASGTGAPAATAQSAGKAATN